MKAKNLLLPAMFVLILSAIACKSEKYPGQPVEVLKIFLQNNQESKYEASKKYSTQGSWAMLEMLKKNTRAIDTNRGSLKDMSFKEPRIEGSKAVVSVYNSKTDENSFFILRKESDKWKVDMSQEGLQEMSRLVLAQYGINVDDVISGKISQDSAARIIERAKQQMKK